ncbi:hypothetical protein KSS87_010016 [Heliosperma pusillum]|nr:hypothetical protein KSS87_010016 [Heliosperma pusillum]
MSIICGLPLIECVYCLACTRWAWKRCLHTAGHDSEDWGLASAEEFEPVPRLCRYILAVYEDDLRNPVWAPPEGYGINPDWLVVKRTYKDTRGHAPPYMVYLDHDHSDIVLAFRGLNMAKEGDYAVLLDNKLGKKKFDGGYVHNGLFRSAVWVLEKESDLLGELLEKYPEYTLTFTGHSLGSGVAALMTMVAVQNPEKLKNIERKRVRGYAIAPARSVSLNLAVRYADVINSVVLQANFLTVISVYQDDFLPRTATPLEDIFKSLLCLPCILCLRCMRDTCISEERMLKDPRRLYAPGRLYHIVERKRFRCGRFPPVVRTAVPVDGRFEHIVLSCNATSDHAIIWIEKEAKRALELMREEDDVMEIPVQQKMERQETIAKEHKQEHKAALQRAVTLSVPHAVSAADYGTFEDHEDESAHSDGYFSDSTPEKSSKESKKKESWDELVARLFDRDESGHLISKKITNSRKELRNTYGNQEIVVQSGSSIMPGRLDPSRVVQLSWQPRVFVYRGFVSDAECDHLISLASGKTNSVVSDAQGVTARSLADVNVKDEVVARVEEKISAWTLLPLGNSRPLQILHYANEEANEKYDFYGNKSAWQLNEPLMATVILSLSNDSRGGDISFPESQFGTSVLSLMEHVQFICFTLVISRLLCNNVGNAILFFNVHPNASPDERSHHKRNPVTEGGMWSAVKIFHLRAFSEINVPTEQANSDCTDEDESCPKWAALGECQRNSVFMVGSPDYYGTCRKSCQVC